MKQYHVIFQPSGRRGAIPEGTTVLEASRLLGVGIESVCGGKKSCGKCLIRLESGTFERYGITSLPDHLSPFTEEEGKLIGEKERAEGLRLACAAIIRGNILIFVPEGSRTGMQVVRKEASEKRIPLNPAVRLFPVTLAPPTLNDPLGDYERLIAALFERFGLQSLEIDYPALLGLPGALRKGNWTVTAAIRMEREILAVFPGQVEEAYGLAIDVGSTTVAGYLCSLKTGKLIGTGSLMNPQVAYGDDVIARITYVMDHPDGMNHMRGAISECLNELIRTVTGDAGLSPTDILEITLVGNTAMHHLFLGIDPQALGISPFTPAVHRSLDIKARDLGLAADPGAHVHILPIEAGFVGADNVGVLIAEEPYRRDEMVLIIDVGTNGEMILGNREKLLSASCATGPALEGAHIRFGMRAAPGAIERIRIDPETLEVSFKIIGEERPRPEFRITGALGICGSGIIDGVAELYRAGIIDRSGRFRSDLATPRLRLTDGKPEFVIAWPEETSLDGAITITQQDVRNVQLAKGALYAGAKLMMKRLGIAKLDRVILAGAFGSYIDKTEAMILGMFPDCDLDCVSSVGNAAGDGARIALLNRDKRLEAEEMAPRVEYLELTLEKGFQEEFMAAMFIPHMTDAFPHLPPPGGNRADRGDRSSD
ncbi:MAG: ASKHA domain-containing protein [Deltaproteobacteria bacterium]|nr:ASKHA domain-containing protein [Deltaproteobacteria bacterium]